MIDLNTFNIRHWAYYIYDLHGSIDYTCLVQKNGILNRAQFTSMLSEHLSKYKFLFADGSEKCQFARLLLTPKRYVFDLSMFECPSWKSYYYTPDSACMMHTNTVDAPACSLSRASRMRKCFSNYVSQLNLFAYSPRVKTFGKWSNSAIEGKELATYGFVHTPEDGDHSDDTVTCIYCGLELQDWCHGDKPLTEHIRNNANCSQFISI